MLESPPQLPFPTIFRVIAVGFVLGAVQFTVMAACGKVIDYPELYAAHFRMTLGLCDSIAVGSVSSWSYHVGGRFRKGYKFYSTTVLLYIILLSYSTQKSWMDDLSRIIEGLVASIPFLITGFGLGRILKVEVLYTRSWSADLVDGLFTAVSIVVVCIHVVVVANRIW